MSDERIALRRMTHALSFDGVDDYVEIPDVGLPASTFTSGFTLSAWINPKSIGENGNGFIFAKEAGTSGQSGFMLRMRNLDRLALIVNAGGEATTADYGIDLKGYVFITVSVSSASLVTMYLNGVVSGTPTTVNALSQITTTNALRIGNRSGATDRTFDGSIAEPRIFNQALTADQVSNLYHNAVVPDSCVAEYFNSIDTDGAGDTLTDSVGSNDGTISGATWSTETPISEQVAIGDGTHALSFDGSNDVVTATKIGNLASGFAYRVKFLLPELPSTTNALFHNVDTATSLTGMTVANNGNIQAGYYTGSYGSKCGNLNLEINKFYDLIFVWDGTNALLYNNGILVSKNTATSPTLGTTAGLAIGARTTPANSLKCVIDDVKYWTSPLTAQQVYNLHYNKIVPTEGLVAEYFNSIETDGAGTVLTDSVGSNDGTISGATWTPASEGNVAVPSVMPHVLGFDGVNDKVEIGTDIIDASTSVIARMKYTPKNISGTERYINAHSKWSLSGDGEGVQFVLYGVWASAIVDVPRNKESDVLAVYNKSTLRIYVDGLLRLEEAHTENFPAGTETFQLGVYSVSQFFEGNLNGVQVWKDIDFTPEQVLNLHKHNIIPTTGLVGNWDRISDDGTTLIDSVNGNDGTITGATRVTTLAGIQEPKKAIVPYVGSVEFDGNTDVDLGTTIDNNLASAGEFTLSVDIMPFQTTKYTMPICLAGAGIGKIGIANTVGGRVQGRITDGSGTEINFTSDADKLTCLNDWNTISLTFDGSFAIVYLNGQIVRTQAITGLTVADGANVLGERPSGNDTFIGRIANAKVYNRALTTSEVETLHKTNTTPYDNDSSICVLNLEAKTDVLSGSSWRDVSGNGNHGAITGATLSAERPHGNRRVLDGNLVKNGDFSVRPYLVAPTTTMSRWVDGTALGSTVNKPYGWYIGGSGAGGNEAQFTTDGFKISTTATGKYISFTNSASPSEGIKVKPNTTYIMSGWMETVYTSGDATNGGAIALITYNSAGGAVNTVATAYIKTTTDWTYYEKEFTTGATEVFVRFDNRIYGHQGTGTLIMSAEYNDIKLKEV